MTENKKEVVVKKYNSLNNIDMQDAIKAIMQSKITKTIVIGAVAFGILYLSKYLINETAATIKAVKNLREAIKQ